MRMAAAFCAAFVGAEPSAQHCSRAKPLGAACAGNSISTMPVDILGVTASPLCARRASKLFSARALSLPG